MAERLSDEDLRYHPDEALFNRANEAKEERKLLEERLKKLETSKGGVSEVVYQRVRSDYLTKLDGCAQQFDSIRKDLDQELVTLTEKKLLLEGNLRLHVEEVEELKLRHSLGEVPSEEYEGSAKKATEEIKRVETALKGIHERLKSFEEILGPPPPPKAVPPPKPVPPSPRVVEAPSMTHRTPHPEPGIESTAKIQVPTRPKEKGKEEEEKVIPVLCLIDNGKIGHQYPIEKNITIGRSPSNDVVLKEVKISRQHAQILVEGNSYILVDLKSSNGTYVGGERIADHILVSGDEIRIGKSTLLFKIPEKKQGSQDDI